jgi:toxin ParE1/3/4
MQIRWSSEAADDFESAIRRILQDNPTNAQRVAQIIYDRIAVLTTFPNRGRAGRIEGTRELVIRLFHCHSSPCIESKTNLWKSSG